METPRNSALARGENELLEQYLQEISKYPLLSAEEEKELGRRIQRGDEAALECLVQSNLRFVVSYAKRYAGWGQSLLDLIDEGNIGLLQAARRFDPERNVRFLTYASWWVRRSIFQALSRENAAFGRRGADAAGAGSIAKDAGLLPHFVSRVISLSTPIDPEESTELADRLASTAPSVEEELVQKTFTAQTKELLRQLSAREARVLRLRFGLDGDRPHTLQEIGDELGLTRQRVQQIERGAIAKLKRSAKARALQAFLN